jgi:rRNA-processing protein FCF1
MIIMAYVVLDTNFILSCIRKKIDFFNDIEMLGMKIIIPDEVAKELEKFKVGGKKNLQGEASVALAVLEQHEFKKVNLNAKNVDNGIVALARKDKDLIIATLDSEMRSKFENRKMVIRGEKKLEII